MKFSEIVVNEAIIPTLQATERDAVITELVDAIIAAGVCDAAIREKMIEKLLDRERKGSTGFGRGVAVPHVKIEGPTRLAAAIGLSDQGVEFNALDKQPVHSVFLLVSPADSPEDHLQAMEVIFKNLGKPTFRRFLRQARSVQEVVTLLEEADTQQLAG